MERTKIETFDATWNPISGCLHGCEYCYARNIAERFRKREGYDLNEDNTIFIHHFDGSPTVYELKEPCFFEEYDPFGEKSDKDKIKAPYPYGFKPTFHRYRLNDYIGKKGRNIFVCSMADLFGKWVPDEWIEEVFEACEKAPQHNYLFLTKNPARYEEYGVKAFSASGIFNLWYGMSVTTEKELGKTWMLPEYCHTFISIEPILEDFNIVNGDLRLSDLEWVIIGDETGRRKDKVVPERKWIEDIAKECERNGIPIFMKSSLADIWGEPLIQEFPEELERRNDENP